MVFFLRKIHSLVPVQNAYKLGSLFISSESQWKCFLTYLFKFYYISHLWGYQGTQGGVHVVFRQSLQEGGDLMSFQTISWNMLKSFLTNSGSFCFNKWNRYSNKMLQIVKGILLPSIQTACFSCSFNCCVLMNRDSAELLLYRATV